MAIGLFKREYTLRRYGEQKIVGGYAAAPYTDTTAILNVQPLSSDDLQALPEGERSVKRVKSFGSEKITAANEYSNVSGDRLFYHGFWYECKSSVYWDHTFLRHYQSEFVILPPGEQEEPPEVLP